MVSGVSVGWIALQQIDCSHGVYKFALQMTVTNIVIQAIVESLDSGKLGCKAARLQIEIKALRVTSDPVR